MRKILVLLIIINVLVVTYFLGYDYFKKEKNNYISLGYSEISSEKIELLNLEKSLNNEYYQTLDMVLNEDKFIDKYLEDYKKITYISNDSFVDSINYLLKKSYTSSQINDILFIFENKYYKYDYLERYLNYYKNNSNIEKKNIVIYVNIGLDNDFYTNIKTVDNPDDLLVLVNKYNKLPDDYIPSDLVSVDSRYVGSSSERKMKKVAHDALVSMIDDINKEGMNLWLNSGFRTKEYQNSLFTKSVSNNGLEHALIYSAKTRHSEHETGLAADIASVKWMIDGFEKYTEYTWLKENAFKYGFIERYPEGKEFITGYAYEPWHWRYVGIEAATIIHNDKITFEEYSVKYLNY